MLLLALLPPAFLGFYNKAKSHAELGRKALNETDPEKATNIWKQIFGDRFPKTEGTKSESLLATSVGLKSPSFPNRPVTL